MSDATFMVRCEPIKGRNKKRNILDDAKPILFNTDMVRAILARRKTVTRRVVKPQPPENTPRNYLFIPPYRTGDILYVRETWNKVKRQDETESHYEYRASCENPNYFSDGFMAEWRPSIHMPKEAARLFLLVTDVRVERLQDIKNDQAVAEARSENRIIPDAAIWFYTTGTGKNSLNFGIAPSRRNLTASSTAGMPIPGYGLSSSREQLLRIAGTSNSKIESACNFRSGCAGEWRGRKHEQTALRLVGLRQGHDSPVSQRERYAR